MNSFRCNKKKNVKKTKKTLRISLKHELITLQIQTKRNAM